MSVAWRIRLGWLLLLLGIAGIILCFGPLRFGDRLSGRVETEGTVQWGVAVEATSDEDVVADGEYGAWKVDYEIDGSGHTGMIIGEYHAGQQITIAAPPDGSIYSMLHKGTPTGLRVLSWFLMPLTLTALGVGGWWIARGMRAQDAHTREVARQQLTRLYPQMFPPPQSVPQYAPRSEPRPGADPTAGEVRRRGDGPDFFAPYDL